MSLQPFTDHLVSWAIDFAIKQVVEYTPKLAKAARESMQTSKPFSNNFYIPFQGSRTGIVGREKELRSIRAALRDEHKSHIVYFYGPGGIGKTRLLQESDTLVSQEKRLFPLNWVGILDLYHNDLRSPLNLQREIAIRLDPSKKIFTDYWNAVQTYEQHRKDGIAISATDGDSTILFKIFMKDFNLYTATYRPVIAFDTLEYLDEQPASIQFISEFSQAPFSVRDWLIKFTVEVKNTVILLAGREQPKFCAALQQAHNEKAGKFEIIDLSGLSREETRQLLEIFSKKSTAKAKNHFIAEADRLWQLTGGIPVQLALAIELARQGQEIDFVQSEKSSTDWEQYLVREFFNYDDPARRALFFLAIARKGLTVDLLAYLDPEHLQQECEQSLGGLSDFNLAKKRIGTDDLFLHDALYELFDRCMPQTHISLNGWFEEMCDYYREKQIQDENDRLAWGDSTVKLLYYELRRDFPSAFDKIFIRWSESAIMGREADLDMQLNSEMLAFINSHAGINTYSRDQFDVVSKDSTIRWVKRFIAQAKYAQAIALSETVLKLGGAGYFQLVVTDSDINLDRENRDKLKKLLSSTDALFWGHLLTYYGDALTYISAPENKVDAILEKAIKLLMSVKAASDPSKDWLRNRILGRAYDRRGYLARLNGHYGKSVDYYTRALPFYKQADIIDEHATTSNNLAFVSALLGDTKKAKLFADQSFEHRQSLGQQYPIALSYNTRGLIQALETPQKSIRECLRALHIFEDIDSVRGIGLACNALGYILRKQGEGWETGLCTMNKSIDCFRQSAQYLKRAAEVFEKQDETARLWESYNELGSLNYDWGRAIKYSGYAGYDEKFKSSREFHLLALKIAQDQALLFQEADTCDDLAVLSAACGEYSDADKWIQRSIDIVPDEYKLGESTIQPKPLHNGEVYWLIMAKTFLHQGQWNLKLAEKTSDSQQVLKAVQYLTIAYVYYQFYWPDVMALRRKAIDIAMRIKQDCGFLPTVKSTIIETASAYGADVEVLLSAL